MRSTGRGGRRRSSSTRSAASAAARGELTGGSTLPLWYGILGTALMLVALVALPAHRRRANAPLRAGRRWWPAALRPSRRCWLQAHVWLSALALVLILCHCGLE